ncbi:glycosyltransferase family 4 protein [Verrucomicrobium spinosum]|uniref:glycosyltransferase family 4 protein n=1 Tax=Verrucomicrobium spinosum TaxID=2736 RepID=UPI0009463D44|nr:glycosyltransferase family 4 protein [Verrucomicrobium spinosum]
MAQAGLADRVILLPGLRNDDRALPDAYAACDAFVLPSRHEPFGIVVLEAWSASRPVIASRVGGLVGLVKDECNGLCFDPGTQGSVEQLAAQMERLITDQAFGRRSPPQGGGRPRRDMTGPPFTLSWNKFTSRQSIIIRPGLVLQLPGPELSLLKRPFADPSI